MSVTDFGVVEVVGDTRDVGWEEMNAGSRKRCRNSAVGALGCGRYTMHAWQVLACPRAEVQQVLSPPCQLQTYSTSKDA
jgi:hypothetical protein